MLEEGSTEGIDVGVGILDLSDGSQNAGDGIEALAGQVANIVVLDVAIGESLEVEETGVGVSEHCVAIAGNDTTLLEGLAHVLFDDGLAGLFSLMEVLQLSKPLQALLVGESVEGSGQSVHGSGEGKVGIGECGSDEVAGMS